MGTYVCYDRQWSGNIDILIMNIYMDTIILGIESSCDDTSAAVIKNGVLLSSVIASQALHESVGRVVPDF